MASYQLSIAIPVYQRQIRQLVRALLQQVQSSHAPVEILVFDDGSDEPTRNKNRWLTAEPGVVYHEEESNLGRAAIRNRLAAAASAANILFLDDDSVLTGESFLPNYLSAIERNATAVICGGRIYREEIPAPNYRLHWKYGHQKESKPARERSRNPWDAFHSNNFSMPKKLWQKIPFDEQLKRYGHEDTLLGFELKTAGIAIEHIDNPVLHGQLETNAEFLDKSRAALENLKEIYHRQNRSFNQSVRLLRSYEQLKKSGMRPAIAALFRQRGQNWEQHLLHHPDPSLRIFNLYRLGYFCQLS